MMDYVELVIVYYDFIVVSYDELFIVFFVGYDFMQFNWQGLDVGLQYCFVIFYVDMYEKAWVEVFI